MRALALTLALVFALACASTPEQPATTDNAAMSGGDYDDLSKADKAFWWMDFAAALMSLFGIGADSPDA